MQSKENCSFPFDQVVGTQKNNVTKLLTLKQNTIKGLGSNDLYGVNGSLVRNLHNSLATSDALPFVTTQPISPLTSFDP